MNAPETKAPDLSPGLNAPDSPILDLSVIIVQYNQSGLLRRCLETVFEQPHRPARVIVVDNASADDSVEMVRTCFPDVHLIANAENRGFAAANNQGFTLVDTRYALLLNSDTEVLDDALAVMVRRMDEDPGIGVLGPQLLNKDGSIQHSGVWLEPWWREFVFQTSLCGRLGWKWPEDYRNQRGRDFGLACDVTDVIGACLMVRREAWEGSGLLDEGYFFWYEERDWCLRILRNGWRVRYDPSARVIHLGGASTPSGLAPIRLPILRGRRRFYRKVYGLGPAVALGGGLGAIHLLSSVAHGARYVLRRREHDAEWCRHQWNAALISFGLR